jgi:hypothetical protein
VQQRRLVEQALKIVEMRVPRSSGRYALVEEVYGDGVRRRRRLVEIRGDAGEEEIVEKRWSAAVKRRSCDGVRRRRRLVEFAGDRGGKEIDRG